MKYWFGIVALLLLTFATTACSAGNEEVEESTPHRRPCFSDVLLRQLSALSADDAHREWARE